MSNIPIAFIGGGNIARSLIAGLIADGHHPQALTVSDPDHAKTEALVTRFGIVQAASNAAALKGAEVVVLCVKPQLAHQVCGELAAALSQPAPLLISVMAGVTESSLQQWLKRPQALVRAMPNTPMLVQSGAIGLYANALTNASQRNLAEEILRTGGLTRWVDHERDIDAVTAISGSGPAYFLLFMEALEAAGIEQGLTPETARLLAIQTALGAARMAVESDESPEQLRARVTSPGGTTESAIRTFEEGAMTALVAQAVTAARLRAEELSKLFAEDQA